MFSILRRIIKINFILTWIYNIKAQLNDIFSLYIIFNRKIFPICATNHGSLKIPIRVNPSPVTEDKGENGLSTGY